MDDNGDLTEAVTPVYKKDSLAFPIREEVHVLALIGLEAQLDGS